MNQRALTSLCIPTLLVCTVVVSAQTPLGTAFTYQGQLKQSGSPVNAQADFQFMLWDADAGGNPVPPPLSVDNWPVANGLFTVRLDFGASAFTGNARWLEIAVRSPAGNGSYTTLSPRQPLSPTPYALEAGGIIHTPGQQEIFVNNERALRLEFAEHLSAPAPNVIAGFSGNAVTPGMSGATIAGGGWPAHENRVADEFGTVGGGAGNTAGNYYAPGTGYNSTVGGGSGNTASGPCSTVSGGCTNTASNAYASVGGGINNTASGYYSTVAGGQSNTASGQGGTVAGGGGNTASGLVNSTVGGGGGNVSSGDSSTVAGGEFNTASGWDSTVPGGKSNRARGRTSFAAGNQAKANHDGTFVWADWTAADFQSTGPNQFLIRAAGGVGIGTNSPQSKLHVAGAVQANDGLITSEGTSGGGTRIGHTKVAAFTSATLVTVYGGILTWDATNKQVKLQETIANGYIHYAGHKNEGAGGAFLSGYITPLTTGTLATLDANGEYLIVDIAHKDGRGHIHIYCYYDNGSLVANYTYRYD